MKPDHTRRNRHHRSAKRLRRTSIQRVSADEAVRLLRRAREGGMRFFDTARAYTDSEEKLGLAFGGQWDGLYVATKTAAKTPEDLRADLETSLRLLQRDYIDIYQFHMAGQCYRPGDGTGMYEAMLEAKAQGKIRHIGITAHKIGVAEDIIASGLYETLQYPFSYLSTPREAALAESCRKANMGLIAMKALAGGLVTNAGAAFAYIAQYDNVLPIWGIQRPEELEQWLGFFRTPASLTPELRSFIEKERSELTGEFCRGCGYCLPCPAGIQINQCARISLMMPAARRPRAGWPPPCRPKWRRSSTASAVASARAAVPMSWTRPICSSAIWRTTAAFWRERSARSPISAPHRNKPAAPKIWWRHAEHFGRFPSNRCTSARRHRKIHKTAKLPIFTPHAGCARM